MSSEGKRRPGRRALLVGGALAGVAAAFPVGRWLTEGRASAASIGGPHGALRPDPRGILDLLEGFEYRVLQRRGEPMTDGRQVPWRPDGMACFEGPDGALILTRNHELPRGLGARLVSEAPPPEAYDPEAMGGVTRVVLDPESLAVRSSNLLLAGTDMNCSGGASPWGWLSCEESFDGGHGHVFLCDPHASAVQAPRRIDGYGRFRHEAAAVRPDDAVAYLTEDQGDACLYRFVPHDPASPFEGRLQALRILGRDGEDTAPHRAGQRWEIGWVDLGDPSPERDELRHVARARGAATFRRGEGACFAGGALHFTATTGGPIGGGQIFRLDDEGDGGTLEVIAASTDRGALDMPDNVAMSPHGTLFVVEDGEGHDFIRGVGADGRLFALGRNAASDGEITGVCFAPDGGTMFVNLQQEGLTVAIRGPFEQLA